MNASATLIGQTFRCDYTGQLATVIQETVTTVTLRDSDRNDKVISRYSLYNNWTRVSETPADTARWAFMTQQAKRATMPHLTFDEQAAAGHPDCTPCACWYAGHGDITGYRKDKVVHPEEFGQGWLSAYEREHDI